MGETERYRLVSGEDDSRNKKLHIDFKSVSVAQTRGGVCRIWAVSPSVNLKNFFKESAMFSFY